METSLICGGREHRLRWAQGRLVTPDHPEPDRERALVALGGEPVACLELLDAWAAHADDLDLLVLTSRGASDPLLDPAPNDGVRYSRAYRGNSAFSGPATTRVSARPRGSRRTARGWTSYRPLNSGPHPHGQPAELDAALFATFGRGLTDRWVATVIATWTDRIREADHRVSSATPALQAALYGRVLTTIRSLDSRPGPVELIMVNADASRSVMRRDGQIRCELPFSWLGDVWARGFATVLGHLCLAIDRAADDDWQLLVADPHLRHAHAMTIRLAR